MRTTPRVAALVALALWLCPKAYAPIYSVYPGLSSLIAESDVIAAITILQQLSDEDLGGSARYNVQFDKVLKGNPHEKKVVVWLRHLEIQTIGELQSAPPPQRTPLPGAPAVTHYFGLVDSQDPFRPSSRWIAFLAKRKDDKEAAYENVNCEGSTFPLSPLRDLDVLKADSLPDTLIQLFREYVDFKRNELKDWEGQLDAFIHKNDK
jgi:hypothetical protein